MRLEDKKGLSVVRWTRRGATRNSALRFSAALLTLTASVPPAHASMLQPPSIGGRDTGLSGNAVAAPSDAPSILSHNAAGVVGQPGAVTGGDAR